MLLMVKEKSGFDIPKEWYKKTWKMYTIKYVNLFAIIFSFGGQSQDHSTIRKSVKGKTKWLKNLHPISCIQIGAHYKNTAQSCI